MDKFTLSIPSDPASEESDVPHFFEPGKILKSIEHDKKLVCMKQQEAEVPMEESVFNTEENVSLPQNVCTEMTDAGNNEAFNPEPSTKFGSAFSNLKCSKFYEEENEVKAGKGAKTSSALLVNPRQKGNPLLKNIRNVPWEFAEMEPDYLMGKSSCALFLSMRYHNLFPNYIHERLKALGKSYQLTVLLVQVDVVEPTQALKDLSVIAILADCTLLVCWSAEEAGNYLETYKMFENKSPDLIKEKHFDDTFCQVIDCLTCIRSVNKTDAAVLLSTFGTLAKVFQASVAELAVCPGIGPLKAKRIHEALCKPVTYKKNSN